MITPDVSQGILGGVTRDTVMTLAREQIGTGTGCRGVDRAELDVAENPFLGGTAAQIDPVTKVDGRRVAVGARPTRG